MTALQPPDFQGTLTRVVDSANAVDWWRWLLRWIGALQFLYAALIGASMLGTLASKGALGLLERDTQIPPSVMGLLFVFCMGQATRGMYPRYQSLPVTLGQVVYSLIVLVYTLRGELSLSVLAVHGGLCILSVIAIIGATQRANSIQKKAPAKNAFMPAMGLSLLIYGIGLGWHPDTAIAPFAQSPYGVYIVIPIVLWMCFGGGYMLFNHILAKWLFTAVFGQFLYTLLAIALLMAFPTSTSLPGLAAHVGFSITAAYIILIQTDYPG